MSCSSCTEVKPVPLCFTTLNIGTVAISTAYKVYFKNVSTGRENVYAVTSSGAGLLSMLRQSGGETVLPLIPGYYEIKAQLATETNLEDVSNITINSVAYTCLLVRFTEVFDGVRELEEYTTVTLEV